MFTRFIGGVPTTPGPNTSAKVARCKWEAYRDTNRWCVFYLLPKGGRTDCKSTAIEMGGVSQYLSKVSGSGGRCDSPDFMGNVSETPTPTTCLRSTAVRPPFVRQHFWKNTGGWGHWNVSDFSHV